MGHRGDNRARILPPTSGTVVVSSQSPTLMSTFTIHSPDRSLVTGEISPNPHPHFGVLAQALYAGHPFSLTAKSSAS
jgi:hypothetical protein